MRSCESLAIDQKSCQKCQWISSDPGFLTSRLNHPRTNFSSLASVSCSAGAEENKDSNSEVQWLHSFPVCKATFLHEMMTPLSERPRATGKQKLSDERVSDSERANSREGKIAFRALKERRELLSRKRDKESNSRGGMRRSGNKDYLSESEHATGALCTGKTISRSYEIYQHNYCFK